jgi:hypothetical protein
MRTVTNLQVLVRRSIPALAVVCIVGLLIGAGLYLIGLPLWLLIVLYILIILITVATIAVHVQYPQARLEDEHLLGYLDRQFRAFSTDTAEGAPSRRSEPERTSDNAEDDLNKRRTRQLEDNRGLSIVHSWKFSEKRDQVADIIIRLREHRDTSTRPSLLQEGKVESVRYELGRRFSDAPMTKTNKEEDFALEVSAYRPMLCLAEATFNDGHPPIYLSRYIDFPSITFPWKD